MHDWVVALLELQELDIRAAKLEEQLAQVPVKIAEAQGIYAAEAEAYDAAVKNCREAEAAIRKIELEIATIGEQKKNFQAKSAIIKNNDEYKAALIQIEQCDKRVEELEDGQLVAMEALEKAQVFMKEKGEVLNEAKHRAQGVCGDLNARKANCEAGMAELAARRPELAAAVDKQLLSKYDRLRNARNNVKTRPCFVPVTDKNCGRCRMAVTEQTVATAKKGEVVLCGSCSAILYYP